MADVKYKDATPVDEPVARPKQKAKPTAPKEQMQNRYEYREELMPLTVKRKNSDSEELKSSPVAGLDLTESEPNPANSYAKGGSASSRADGCAQRGKTRGMML